MKHTISAMVQNKPGVLARMAGLFSRRGWNIDSLAVSATEDPRVSRMTITVEGTQHTLEQICNQLWKLVDVIDVLDHTDQECVERELCLVKVLSSRETRSDIAQLCEIFGATVVDIGDNNMTVQLTGDEGYIDAFVRDIAEFDIQEMVRTGKVVLVRGPT